MTATEDILQPLKETQPVFFEQAVVPLFSNRVHHAYLIETHHNSFETIEDCVLRFIYAIYLSCDKKENFSVPRDKLYHLLQTRNYPDFIEIHPNNHMIKKEQLLSTMHLLQNKSVYGGYQIYVIYEADKLNTSAANTVLKFLEEPEPNIIAIFLTDNRYQIINTILSRCLTVSLFPKEDVFTLQEKDQNVIQLVENIYHCKEELLLHYSNYYDLLFKTRDQAEVAMKQLISIFKYNFNTKLRMDRVEKSDDLITGDKLLKIIFILEESLKKLQYNVNLKLWLDEVLLQLTEV